MARMSARCRENNHEANFRAFPLKCLAAALVVAVNSFRALQNEEYGVKRVSCEVRSDENNENKYVPRAFNAFVARYVCYIEIDFAKNENVFFEELGRRMSAVARRPIAIVDGHDNQFFFLAPLPFSAAIARVSLVTRDRSRQNDRA